MKTGEPLKQVNEQHQDDTPPIEYDIQVLRDEYGCSRAESIVGAMYACGMTRKNISLAIHVSQETVKSHLKSVFKKMNVRTKGELMLKIQCRRGQ